MNLKKVLASITGFTMILSSLTFNVSNKNAYITEIMTQAASYSNSGKCGENITWVLEDDGTLTLSGTGSMQDWNSIESPFYSKREIIKNVIISSGITSIGKNAFYFCNSIESVTIPNTVVSIGDFSFYECNNITEINMPNSVTNIGDRSFAYCRKLSTVVMSDNVIKIDNRAFDGCSELSTINIPKSTEYIGADAFYETIWLRKKRQENPLVIINNILIDGRSYQENELIIPDNVTAVCGSAFKDCKFSSVILNDSIKVIEPTTFAYCKNLSSVYLGNSIEDISNGAFTWCKKLTSISIPDSVKIIRQGAFSDCTSLSDITIGNSVEKICYTAFQNCTSINSIIIPASVNKIEQDAFKNCSNLQSITIFNDECEIYESIATICNRNDNGSYYYTGTIRGSKDSSANHFAQKYDINFEELKKSDDGFWIFDNGDWGNNLKYELDEKGTLFLTGNGEICSYGEIATKMEIRNKVKKIVLKEGITSIGDSSFYYFSECTDVIIPDTVKQIGNNAFQGCSALTKFNMPNSIESIGENAFKECSNLTSVSLSDSISDIKPYSFSSCPKLDSIIISESVKNIGFYAFSGCSKIVSIDIPKSVDMINAGAFFDCKSLKYIKILNPNCEFSEAGIFGDLEYQDKTIIGYKNSTAENLANEKGMQFISIEGTSITTTEVTTTNNITSTTTTTTNTTTSTTSTTTTTKKPTTSSTTLKATTTKNPINMTSTSSNKTTASTTTSKPSTTTTTSATTITSKLTTKTTTSATTTAITSKATNDKRYIGTWTAYAYSDYENAPKKDLSNESVSFTLYDDMTGIMFNFGAERKAELTWANESNDCITVNWKGNIASFNYSNDELVFKRINGKIYYFVESIPNSV